MWSRGKNRLSLAVWTNVIRSIQHRVAFQSSDRPWPGTITLHRLPALPALLGLRPSLEVPTVNDDPERLAHHPTTQFSRMSLDLTKGRVGMLVVPRIQLGEHAYRQLDKRLSTLRARHLTALRSPTSQGNFHGS